MWFDLAKNYLKEAQNVIDKALDINDVDLFSCKIFESIYIHYPHFRTI